VRRSNLASLLGIVAVAAGLLLYTFVSGNRPLLGLDLQGGVSVVLQPAQDVPSDTIDQSIAIIRNRVDALGVAEPDIIRQGDSVVVSLPGVKEQKRALEIVGQTAELRFRPVQQVLPPRLEDDAAEATTTTAPPAEPTTTVAAAGATTTAPGATTTTTTSTTTTTIPPSSRAKCEISLEDREADVADQPVELPECDDDGREVARYQLGPTAMTGKALRTARATFNNQWLVDVEFTGEGGRQFDQLAASIVNQQLAIVLDSEVISAPVIQQAQFNGEAQITGNFSEQEARDLALVLRFGALPVQLEPQTVQTVSASLGQDSLRAGVGAGLVGLALVALYMIVYYRALGVVVWLGVAVSAALLWSIISYLGDTAGLALTLAGATGIIVSIGVTVDSYVVYFERLKDEVRSGRTIRASVDRGFRRAYRTILAADTVSFIGAALLYFLTVGPVRGFAFFLGLSTLLDVIVAWFFTRPLVAILGRNRVFTEARWLGVARGLAAGPSPAPAPVPTGGGGS
jgi:preprotein translocase subunit SecD